MNNDEQQMSRALQILDKLEQMVKKGPRLWSRAMIDEEVFFNTTASLKKAIPESILQAESIIRANLKNNPETATKYDLWIFRLVDELEQLAENGKGHLFGRVFVDAKQFLNLIVKIRQTLPQTIETAAKILSDSPIRDNASKTDRFLLDAKAEAAHIIEAAQAEAARIIAEAHETETRKN